MGRKAGHGRLYFFQRPRFLGALGEQSKSLGRRASRKAGVLLRQGAQWKDSTDTWITTGVATQPLGDLHCTFFDFFNVGKTSKTRRQKVKKRSERKTDCDGEVGERVGA